MLQKFPKQTFGKELGRQGYHVVLSCPVGEGDPQTMYQSYLRLEFEPETNKDRETDRYTLLYRNLHGRRSGRMQNTRKG